MPPSDVARVMSASRMGLLLDDHVPCMHMMADLMAAKDIRAKRGKFLEAYLLRPRKQGQYENPETRREIMLVVNERLVYHHSVVRLAYE